MAALVRVLRRLLFVAASLAVFTTATWAQGNPGAAAESATVAKLQSIARKNISDNRSNFPDDTDFFRAAPGYPDVYLSDLGLTMTGLPEAFSAEQVKNIIDKFLLCTNSSGWIPMALKKDGSVYVYCSAWDRRCAHPTGDGAFFLPLLEELYWRRPLPFDHPEFLLELKYDGFRSLCVIHNGRTELISRNGNSFKSFETLRKQLRAPFAGKTVLDGEIVCLRIGSFLTRCMRMLSRSTAIERFRFQALRGNAGNASG